MEREVVMARRRTVVVTLYAGKTVVADPDVQIKERWRTGGRRI
jgi:hypothetical protein